MILPAKQKGKTSFQHAESILALGFLAVILLGQPVYIHIGGLRDRSCRRGYGDDLFNVRTDCPDCADPGWRAGIYGICHDADGYARPKNFHQGPDADP